MLQPLAPKKPTSPSGKPVTKCHDAVLWVMLVLSEDLLGTHTEKKPFRNPAPIGGSGF